jgi:hypothetical protein
MDTVYIESAKQIAPRDLRPILSQRWLVEDSAGGGLVVHGADSRVYILTEVDPDKPNRHQLLLNYSDVGLVKAVLEVIADDPELVVDNDFGVVMPGDKFVARLRAEPTWNWGR